MPKQTKASIAAKLREQAKRLARQAAQALLVPSSSSEPSAGMPTQQQLSGGAHIGVEVEVPMKPMFTPNVKPENLKVEVNPFEASEHLEEIKVEPEEPQEGETDPIGRIDPTTGLAETLPGEEEDQKPDINLLNVVVPHEPRCQFCLKLYVEAGGRGIIPRNRIVYVLGQRWWGSPRERPRCCKGCKRLFELFYEFKKSCLAALSRPEFLLAQEAAMKVVHEVVDLKPVLAKEKKSEERPDSGDEVDVVGFGSLPETFEQNAGNLEPAHVEQNIESKPIPQSTEDDWTFETDGIDNQTDSDEWNLEPPLEPFGDEIPPKKGTRKRKPHKPNESKKGRKYCFRCRKFYENEATYLEHKPNCTKPARDPPPLACPQCPKRFNRQEHLTYHINQHNGLRTVPCRREGCNKMFFRPSVRHTHERTCGKGPEVMCTMCAAVFRTKSALNTHMATHGDPTHFCEVCKRGFYSKANLQKHAAAHSDARNFECKVCGKRFKSYEANRVHQRVHTQEKPYVCPHCGMAFMYNCVLKTHLQKSQCGGPSPVDLARRELEAAARFIQMH
ncbi:zinc finger protein 260-like isoform X1 [Aedes albopictus]|uniref:C2H2-type domain-containing protein n=1 Tax=Aedes albopictus TaxID=7160 RepID=A0ABM1Y2J1_AEDAL